MAGTNLDNANSYYNTTGLSLNIGCGGTLKYPFRNLECSLNCDVLRPEQRVANFLLCDACHLPFKEKVFSRTLALHLIEHLGSPSIFLRECKRVTDGYLNMITPNLYSENSFKDESHVQHFSVSTLRTLLEQFFSDVKIVGEGGFWIPLKGNTFAFRALRSLVQRFAFLASNLFATCRSA
jgi:hypothetical protein